MHRQLSYAALALLLAAAIVRAEDKPAELPKPDAEGWITLFNGKDLTGWQGDPNIWKVVDGYISGKADKGTVKANTFLICPHKFGNFILEAKWILVEEAGNSGIQYRSKVHDPAKWVVGGYQADIGKGWYGALYEERGRGVLWKASDEGVKTVKAADWNQYVIKCEGSKVSQVLNGVTTGELDDKDEAKRALEGIIALQYHAPGGFEVRFKDIRIKLLDK